MNTLTLEQVVAKVRDLPSLPSVVVQLIRTFGQADVAVAELSAQIAKDQALAAKTLRLANSSFYGLQSRVRTIDQAITVLGFDSVRALVTSAGIVGQFGAGSHGGLDFTAFWRHAVGTALCAKSVARLAGSSQEYAFVSGLLHDIGRLVLATRFPDEYAAALAWQREEDCEPSHAERQVLGLDHAVIVHALDLDGDPDELVPPLAQDAWDSLGIEAAALQRVFAETDAEFEQACQILTAGE